MLTVTDFIEIILDFYNRFSRDEFTHNLETCTLREWRKRRRDRINLAEKAAAAGIPVGGKKEELALGAAAASKQQGLPFPSASHMDTTATSTLLCSAHAVDLRASGSLPLRRVAGAASASHPPRPRPRPCHEHRPPRDYARAHPPLPREPRLFRGFFFQVLHEMGDILDYVGAVARQLTDSEPHAA